MDHPKRSLSEENDTAEDIPAKMSRDSTNDQEIPILPGDKIRMIIDEMPTADRAPLWLVSKRFHAIESSIGKRKFDRIDVYLNENAYVINAIVQGVGSYNLTMELIGDIRPSIMNIRRLFFKAFSEYLNIYVTSPRDARSAILLSTCFPTLRWENVYISFDEIASEQGNMLSFLSAFRNCRNVSMEATWDSGRKLLHIQESDLPFLPQFELFQIYDSGLDKGENIPDGMIVNNIRFVMDGPTMIGLIKYKCKFAIFWNVDCTAQEIVDAFKLVCDSNDFEKDVTIFAASSVVDQFITMAEQMVGLDIIFGNRCRVMTDRIRRGRMHVDYLTYRNTGCKPISMKTIDEHGKTYLDYEFGDDDDDSITN